MPRGGGPELPLSKAGKNKEGTLVFLFVAPDTLSLWVSADFLGTSTSFGYSTILASFEGLHTQNVAVGLGDVVAMARAEHDEVFDDPQFEFLGHPLLGPVCIEAAP